MASNSIYYQEWFTGAGHKIRVEIYPQATKTGTNTTLPVFGSRYVLLPDDILLSAGNISAQFEMLPVAVAETGTLQMSVNLSNCPSHLRQRLLGNQSNKHPAVWMVFIAPDGENWDRRALFCGVQKRTPSMSVKKQEQDEIINFDIVDIFRYVFEYIKLNDSNIIFDVVENFSFRADRLYEYAMTESGNKIHSYFAMGSPAERFVFEANNMRNSAWMCSLTDLIRSIVFEVDALFVRLFCQTGDTRVRIDYDLSEEPHAHKRVCQFFNHATTLANEIDDTPATSDLYFIAKISVRDDDDNIVGGELYDSKDGFVKLGSCYDFLKAYCENFASKMTYFVEAYPNADGVPLLLIQTRSVFEGIALEHDYRVDDSPKVLEIVKEGIELEIGSASIRSCRAIVQNPGELDVVDYEVKLTGAESERDYDVLMYFHNHPTSPKKDLLQQPNSTFENPDLKSPYEDGKQTMSYAWGYFPYSKFYHKFEAETLPWADDAPRYGDDQAYYFIKPAENVVIGDSIFTINQLATTHPAIQVMRGGYWIQHVTDVQNGKQRQSDGSYVSSRVGLGKALADYFTTVFGSANNMVLSCSSTNVFLFDLGLSIRSNADSLDLQDFGFGFETTQLAYGLDNNSANVITGVDFDLMTGISKLKIFVKGS